MSTDVPAALNSPAYRLIRAELAKRMLADPALRDSIRLNDDPDGPLFVRTDDAPASGDEARWYEVTTEEAWPYLVNKHKARYGANGRGIVIKLPQ
jgi:hypothetical protein